MHHSHFFTSPPVKIRRPRLPRLLQRVALVLLTLSLFGRCQFVNTQECTDQDPYCNPMALLQLIGLNSRAGLIPRFLYMGAGSEIFGFSIDASTRNLTPLNSGLSLGSTVNAMSELLIDDYNNLVLAGVSGTFFGFESSSDGSLPSLSGYPIGVSYDPGATLLYPSTSLFLPFQWDGSANNFATPHFYNTPGKVITSTTTQNNLGVACTTSRMVMGNNGQFIFRGTYQPSLETLPVDTSSGVINTGGIQSLAGLATIPTFVLRNPAANWIHTVSSNVGGSGIDVTTYSYDGTGTLTQLAVSQIDPTVTSQGAVISAAGDHVIILGNDNSLYVVGINFSSGTSSLQYNLAPSLPPVGIAADPVANYLYVSYSNSPTGGVQVYSMAADGTLTLTDDEPTTVPGGPFLKIKSDVISD